MDNVCAIVVMLHDYRFGLKALLTGGIKNEHLHGTGDEDDYDDDNDEFDIYRRMDNDTSSER